MLLKSLLFPIFASLFLSYFSFPNTNGSECLASNLDSNFDCAEDPYGSLFEKNLDELENNLIPDDFIIEIKASKLLTYNSFNSSSWLIYDHGNNFFTIKKKHHHNSSYFCATFSFTYGQETEYIPFKAYIQKDPFGNSFYSLLSDSDAALNANKYSFKNNFIDEKTYEYNKFLISIGKLNLQTHTNFSYFMGNGNQVYNQWNRDLFFTYSGHLIIKDYQSNNHYVPYCSMMLMAYDSILGELVLMESVFTDSSGNYVLHMSNDVRYSAMIIAAETCDIYGNCFKDDNDDFFSLPLIYGNTIREDLVNFNAYIYYSSAYCQEFWSLICIDYCYRYSYYLNSNIAFDSVTIKYHYDNSRGAYYSSSLKTIFINKSKIGTVDGIKTTENWDILSHEYGHHVQILSGFYGYGPSGSWASMSHYTAHNDCDDIYNYNYPNNSYESCRERGLKLAWNESWPTFFGNCMQGHFYSLLYDVSTCCDNAYQYSSAFSTKDYFDTANSTLALIQHPTDSCEIAIITFLFHLNDLNNDNSFDCLSLSDTSIFSICKLNNVYTFNQLYKMLISNGIDSNSLSKLLLYCRIVPSANDVSCSIPPTNYSFTIDFADGHIYYQFNHMRLAFYNNNVLELFTFSPLYTDITFDLNQLFNLIFAQYQSNTLIVRVILVYSIDPDSFEPDYYYLSPFMSFDKTTGELSLW